MSGDFRGDRGDRQMYEVPCSKCGKTARVPFKPTEGKPVYCKECYEPMRAQRRM